MTCKMTKNLHMENMMNMAGYKDLELTVLQAWKGRTVCFMNLNNLMKTPEKPNKDLLIRFPC